MKKALVFLILIFSSVSLFAIDFNIKFDEGISYCQLTRIEKLEDRSNFVRENLMFGAYFTTQTQGLPLFDLQLDISAYYPFYQAFNGMQQMPKNLICYAFDGYLAAQGTYSKFKYVLITASLGMHYMYQLTDEYHMHYLGLGGTLGLEFPISRGWTIVNRNFFSYDNANLGKNKLVQPFYASYQYHINLGVRYSKRVHNSFSYIDSRVKPENDTQDVIPEPTGVPEPVEGHETTDAL